MPGTGLIMNVKIDNEKTLRLESGHCVTGYQYDPR